MASNSKISIIILNWNGCEVTIDCLNSLRKITYPNFNIVMVDNGSTDNSVEKIVSNFRDEVDILKLDQNYGFTGGNNQGIRYAIDKYNPDYLLLLNNDTTVQKDFLDELLANIVTSKYIYAAVPKIYYHKNKNVLWFAGGSISKFTGIVKHFGIDKVDNGEYDVKEATQFMNGCCALISRKCIDEIGLLDDIFFANSEDADYSLRIMQAGHQILYVPTAIVYHKVSQAFESNKGKWLAFYLAARGLVLIQKKHVSKLIWPFCFAWFFVRWMLYLTIKLAFLKDIKSINGMYDGMVDGLKNRLRFVK